MKKFDRNVAMTMIEIVHENQKQGIGYRELQRQVGLVNHDKKFHKLMNKLRECQIFDNTHSKPGEKIHIRLTKQKYKDYKNADSWLPSTEFNSESDSKVTIRQNRTKDEFLCMAIIVRAAFESTREVLSTKPSRGDVMMEDPIDPSRKICFTMVSKPGIGLEDITIRPISPGRDARMLDRRNFTSLNELFSQHLEISNQKAKNALEYLKNHEPPILRKIKYGHEDRYEIADPILDEYIQQWVISLTAVHQKMYNCYVRGELNRYDKLQYAKWNESLYGIKSKASEIYSNLHAGRKNYRNRPTPYDTSDNLLNHDILAYQDILFGKSDSHPEIHRFRNISKTYPIVNAMLRLSYPAFIGNTLKLLKEKR